MQMGVTKCFDSRPRSAYGESVAPDGSDASIRSKRRDEPRYDYGLLIRARVQPSLKSGTAEAQSCLGPHSILGWDADVRRMISHDGPGGDVNEHGGA